MSITFQPEYDPISNKFITVMMLTSLLRKKINIRKKSLSLLIKKWYEENISNQHNIRIELQKFKNDRLNLQQKGIKYPPLSMFPSTENMINKIAFEIIIEIENINSKQ